MSLPVPPFKTLRIASPQDILRIGVVAACSFRYSPVFDWERPYHEKYPEDTLLSYRQTFASFIKDPEYVVLVAVDKYDPDEGKKSIAIIPPNNGAEIPAKGDEVVVGVACWKLQPGSKRKGQFQNETGSYPLLPSNSERDENLAHCILYANTLSDERKRHGFHNYMACSMVIVHPFYWRRSHGENLVKWGMELSRIDKVKQGVNAAGMGQYLYNKLGWKKKSEICIKGDEIVPQGVSVALMEYDG